MPANGASRPLRRIPAIASFLNPQPALSLGRGDGSSPNCSPGKTRGASGKIGLKRVPSTCVAEVEAIRAAWTGAFYGYAKAAAPVISDQV